MTLRPMTNQVGANNVPVGILFPGERIRTLVARRGDGSLDLVVENRQLLGDPNRTFRIVTLNFLAGGGDSYFALTPRNRSCGSGSRGCDADLRDRWR